MKEEPFILSIGSAVCDTFIESDDLQSRNIEPKPFLLIEEGAKLHVSRLRRMAGGGALNAARCLKHLGFNTAAFFKLAHDEAGVKILQELHNEGIDTHLAITNSSTSTATSFILKAPSGNHPILAYRGANDTITFKELPFEAIQKAEGVYLAPLSGEAAAHVDLFAKKAKEKGIPVFHNLNIHQLTSKALEVLKALPFLTAFMLNHKEAELFFKVLQAQNGHTKIEFSLQNYCTLILEQGTEIAIVTNGPEGVFAASKEAFYTCPSTKTTVLNTVGAGDTCGATIFGSLIKGYPLETALIYGSINSARLLASATLPPRLFSFSELEVEADRLHITVQKTAR
ncbi:TPA: hypothetical protein DDZ86_01005 [Candidatus Dependentiae bacterium]|nr:MAG: Ribokinase [candidate division TM6 bacterium GW2011_GWF2_43_87]HBL98204.1 hypothetical protein [Candidatus Dependentiae bacterium]